MKFLVPLILLLQVSTGGLSDSALKDSLNTKYNKKLIAIRDFPTGVKVRFDGDGKLVEGMPGVFTLDGTVRVESVSVAADRVEIRGKQMFLAYNEKTKNLEESPSGEKMTVEFGRKAGTAVDKIIDDKLVPFESVASLVPGYWSKFLNGKGELGIVVDSKTGVAIPRASEAQGLTPKPSKTPAPTYPKSLVAHGVTGRVTLRVVVDENGKPEVVDLVAPVGYGLDRLAIDAVNQWEYEPARKDGKGVKVYVRVAVNFNSPRN